LRYFCIISKQWTIVKRQLTTTRYFD
jgi:hypothetical protein